MNPITTPLFTAGIALSQPNVATFNVFNLGRTVLLECTWLHDGLTAGTCLGSGKNGYDLYIDTAVHRTRRQRGERLTISPPRGGHPTCLILQGKSTTGMSEVYQKLVDDLSDILSARA